MHCLHLYEKGERVMKVQFWCDMEGICGITQWDQVSAGKPQYEEGRRLYTDEVNAAVRGAKKGGAKEIIVIDGHGAGGQHSFNSWIKPDLEPGAEYITGFRWGCYVEEFAKGCDAILMPGAHAMAGTADGILCHTMSSENWVNAYINGRVVGESGLIAAIAGSFGVPVVFAAGDTATCKEVSELLPGIFTAPVKKGLGRFAARNMAPKDAYALIEATVEKALKSRKKWPKPWSIKGPVEIKIEIHNPDQSVQYKGKVGVEILDSRTVVSRGENAWQAWDQLWRQH
jgi:D-amino peptidase